MNKFLVIGNLTHDPELAQKGDTSYCKFSVAVNRPTAGAEQNYFSIRRRRRAAARVSPA